MNIENPIVPDHTMIGDAVQLMRAAWNAALPGAAVEKAPAGLWPLSPAARRN